MKIQWPPYDNWMEKSLQFISNRELQFPIRTYSLTRVTLSAESVISRNDYVDRCVHSD